LQVGLSFHGRSIEHFGGNEMNLLTGGNLFVVMISISAPALTLVNQNQNIEIRNSMT